MSAEIRRLLEKWRASHLPYGWNNDAIAAFRQAADELEAIHASPPRQSREIRCLVDAMRAELNRIGDINTAEDRSRVIPELTAFMWLNDLDAVLRGGDVARSGPGDGSRGPRCDDCGPIAQCPDPDCQRSVQADTEAFYDPEARLPLPLGRQQRIAAKTPKEFRALVAIGHLVDSLNHDAAEMETGPPSSMALVARRFRLRARQAAALGKGAE